MKSIPIVDLEKVKQVENVSENSEWISAAENIRRGMGEVGFLYLINHGIPEKVISQAFEQSEHFFGMPEEQKLKYKKDTNNNNSQIFDYKKYSGYTPPGTERLSPDVRFEIKEVYDMTDDSNCVYPNTELVDFEEKIKQFNTECIILLKKLLRLLAMALKLDDVNFFLHCSRHYDDPDNYPGIHVTRLCHYPPVPEDVGSATAARCGAHTDYVFLTLLFQDNVGGLEVKTVDGEWIHAQPIPGSIIVNTGDLTDFWTSGIFPATPHRVFITGTQDEKRKKSRYSIAVFSGPDNDTLVTPMDLEKRPEELKRMAKSGKTYLKEPMRAFDHVMGRVATMYA